MLVTDEELVALALMPPAAVREKILWLRGVRDQLGGQLYRGVVEDEIAALQQLLEGAPEQEDEE